MTGTKEPTDPNRQIIDACVFRQCSEKNTRAHAKSVGGVTQTYAKLISLDPNESENNDDKDSPSDERRPLALRFLQIRCRIQQYEQHEEGNLTDLLQRDDGVHGTRRRRCRCVCARFAACGGSVSLYTYVVDTRCEDGDGEGKAELEVDEMLMVGFLA